MPGSLHRPPVRQAAPDLARPGAALSSHLEPEALRPVGEEEQRDRRDDRHDLWPGKCDGLSRA